MQAIPMNIFYTSMASIKRGKGRYQFYPNEQETIEMDARNYPTD